MLAMVVKMASTRFVFWIRAESSAQTRNKAIELAAESLSNVKFVQEKKLIQKYFDEISQDTGKYCFGVDDTLKCLELGAAETLIVWENLDITRHVLRNAAGGNSLSPSSCDPSQSVQRRLSFTLQRTKKKTAKGSWTNPRDSKWNKARSPNPCLNGSPRNTKISVLRSSS